MQGARTFAVLTTLLVTVAVVYGFGIVYALLFADALLFQPRTASYRDGPRLLKIAADDGTPLSAIHLVASGAARTVLYFHGNAEDLGDVLPHLEEFQRRGLSVLAFDYRGYGTTPGRPNERNVHADAIAVHRHLTGPLGVEPSAVVLYGRSLGGGPAVGLAVREPVGGLILDGAFTSAFRVVTSVALLPGDRFRNLDKIGSVRCPVLFLHGRRDRTVPFVHAERMFAATRSPKRALWIDEAGHNDLVEAAGERYWEAVLGFATSPPSEARP